MYREKVDSICEKGVLGCVLGMILWAPAAFGVVRQSEFSILLGLGVLLLLFWGVRFLVRTQYRTLFAPFCAIVLAFTGYAAWSYSHADIEYVARQEILRILLYATVFFAVVDNLNRQEHSQIIVMVLIFSAMVNSFYAIYQFFTDSQTILTMPKAPMYKGRASGTYGCPNHLAGYLEMILPIALALTITGRFKPLSKVFIAYAAVVILGGIGVTISRGGYIATGGALLVLFVSLLWNRDFRLPALGLLIVLIAAGSFFGFRSMKSQLRIAELQQVNSRTLFWKPTVDIWHENFWTGVGPNHWDWRFRQHRPWLAQKRPVYTHNDYLNTLADYGTIGGGIVALGLGVLTWGVFWSWKYLRRSNEISTRPSNRSAIVLGGAVGLLAIAIHSVVDFNMHITANALIAVILMAVLTSHLRFATERFWINPGWPGRLLGLLLAGALGVLFAHQAWQIRAEALTWRAAGKFPHDSSERQALLEKAHQIEPKNPETPLQIGEIIRLKAWEGNDGYQDLLKEAMRWFEIGMKLNRWDPEGFIKTGMCLHWLNEHEKAGEYFEKAYQLDKTSTYVLGYYGWHFLQIGDLEKARQYLAEGYSYYREGNKMAKNYLDLVERLIAEKKAAEAK